MTFLATNSHVRIAIPLSKLRVAPDGSHATLHSPANAHPLKLATGKGYLLILDFGDDVRMGGDLWVAQPYERLSHGGER